VTPLAGKPEHAVARTTAESIEGKAYRMTHANCSCGFTELADERLIDHLLHMFIPDDGQGNDGVIHEEGALLACRCGLAMETADDLDDHFLEVFTPADGIGRDGKIHEVTGGER
jgi:hypothetical protein